MKSWVFGAAFAGALSFAVAAHATAVIDVNNLLVPSPVVGTATGFGAASIANPAHAATAGVAGEIWTVGLTGQLTEIDIFGPTNSQFSTDGRQFTHPAFDVTLSVLSGGSLTSPGTTLLGSVTESSTNISATQATAFDLSALNISATAGELLTFQMSVALCQQVTSCTESWGTENAFSDGSNTNGYAGGVGFTHPVAGLNIFSSQDVNFRTWVAAPAAGPSAAPEPAAWALMLAGFGTAGTVLRRGRRLAAV
jgi:hypothetical protein